MRIFTICEYKLQRQMMRRSYFFAVIRKLRSILKKRTNQTAILIVTIIFLLFFVSKIGVKAGRARKVVRYVSRYQHFVSEAAIRRSPNFSKFVRELKSMSQPPFILLLNNHALNITFNHLCNTIDMDNVHERTAIVALDQTAYRTMSSRYPKFKYFLFDSEKLQMSPVLLISYQCQFIVFPRLQRPGVTSARLASSNRFVDLTTGVWGIKYIAHSVAVFLLSAAQNRSLYLVGCEYPKPQLTSPDADQCSCGVTRRIRGEYSALSSYQLFFLFRANLAAALAKRKLSYWMTQQDTLWRSNLADFNLENRYSNADIIVDRIGNEQMSLYQKRDQWINGATYFVRGGWRSAGFFELLSTKLKRWCAPDSAIMTYLCMTAQPNGVVCNWIPHSIMSSSDWLFTDRSHPPHFLQIDHLRSDEKMEVFRQSGLNFLGGNNIAVCNRTAVEHAKKLLQNGTLFPDRYFDFSSRMSEFFLDLLLILIPGGTEFYRKYMFLLVYGDRL